MFGSFTLNPDEISPLPNAVFVVGKTTKNTSSSNGKEEVVVASLLDRPTFCACLDFATNDTTYHTIPAYHIMSQPPQKHQPVTFHIVGDAYVDFFCFLDGDFPENGGDSRLEHPVFNYAGGSSTNTATHLKSLTQQFASSDEMTPPKVILHTVLNPEDQYGKTLLQHAKNHDFPLVNCRNPEDDSWTGHCIAIVSGGERSFMTHQGCVERFRASDLNLQKIIDTPTDIHVHVAGYFNVEGYHHGDLRDALIRLRQKRQGNTTVSLVTQHDASKQWDGGLDDVIGLLDFLIMNELEAERIWQRGRRQRNESTIPSQNPVQDWVSFFSLANPQTFFVVTLGAEGAVAFRNGEILARLNPAIAVKAIDPTGAGDAFTAGFLHGLWATKRTSNQNDADGWSKEALQQGLLWGCAVGTAAVQIRGASNPSSSEDIQELLQKQQAKQALESSSPRFLC